MIKLAKEIIPFFRSIASPENKKTLDLLKKKETIFKLDHLNLILRNTTGKCPENGS